MKKIFGILICMLLIVSAVPTFGSLKTTQIQLTKPSLPHIHTTANWIQTQKLLSSDIVEWQRFGYSVSLDGDTLLIGAVGDNDNGYGAGAAYVFVYTGSSWIQQAKLLASDGASSDSFGCSVALSGDTAIVGARYHDEAVYECGSAYVFVRSGVTWTEQAQLLPADVEEMDYFGDQVSLDGDTALFGVQLDDESGDASGSAYVFTRTDTTWTQQAKLLPSDGEEHTYFGTAVSLKDDTAVIGAALDDDYGIDAGSAYVFTRTGTSWSQQQKLHATDIAAGDNFGTAVSVDGNNALISAKYDDDNGGMSGSVYVFTRTGTTWIQQAKLTASDGESGDLFGSSVALKGTTALIGAQNDDDNGVQSGSAYVFTSTGSIWTEEDKLCASDGSSDDHFGESVSLSGNTALISAYEDDGTIEGSGSAYIFVKNMSNQPPEPPLITGRHNGKINTAYPYTFIATDPDGDNVSYYIEWGDGENTPWTNYYPSGSPGYIESYSWLTKGSYIIRAKAKDVYGAESEWGELTVTMPCFSNQPFIQSYELLKFFMIYINGTGETSTALEEMNETFTWQLIFDFINAEAELRMGRFDLPLWEWIPFFFYLIGPHRYHVVWFLGNIREIDENVYHIEGYCGRISGRSIT